MAQSTLCLLVLFSGVVLFFFKSIKYSKLITLFLILFSFVLLLLLSEILTDFVINSNISFDYKNRLTDLVNLASGDKGVGTLSFIKGRITDYATSIKSFLTHPLFGVGMIYSNDVSIVGMHSELLDFLARYGILGSVLFIPMLKNYFIARGLVYSENAKFLLQIILLYSLFNPFISRTAGIALFWILPIISNIYDQEDKSDDIVGVK
jgi:hypothetical protein